MEPQNHINPAIRIHNDAQGLRWRKPQQTEVTAGSNMTVVGLKAAAAAAALTYAPVIYSNVHTLQLLLHTIMN